MNNLHNSLTVSSQVVSLARAIFNVPSEPAPDQAPFLKPFLSVFGATTAVLHQLHTKHEGPFSYSRSYHVNASLSFTTDLTSPGSVHTLIFNDRQGGTQGGHRVT